ncbi:MAG: mobile mystery protein B [Colwellia sp.]|nr:mobile mystery protein B [Colwellia sp.]
MITNEYVEGATPLDPDELAGLKYKHITTRGQLDELEQANIVTGLLWLKKSIARDDVLTSNFAMDLHKALFKDVWTWAGTFRLTEKNIGIDPYGISVALRNLLDDLSAWIEYKSYPPVEAVLRFHHQLVKIHLFPNGNGRFSRIYADIVAEKYFSIPPINWGGRELDKITQIRKDYINALRAADGGDLSIIFELYGCD